MTTYHVEVKGYCDVIVEANSEQEAFDRAVARIPASSLSIETAELAHKAWLQYKLEQARILATKQTDVRVAKALIDRYENYHNYFC